MKETMAGKRSRGRKKRALLILTAAASLPAALLTAGYTSVQDESAVSASVVSIAAARQAPATPVEMALQLEKELARGAGVLMPDPDQAVRLNGGVIPLDGLSAGFPSDFLSGLVPEETNRVEVWRVTLRAGDADGSMFFYNAKGEACSGR